MIDENMARKITQSNLIEELYRLSVNYMIIYDEYYETGSRDSAFLKDLVDAILGISACLEVYARDKRIFSEYALERLKNSKSYIDSCISFYERKKENGE